jgi:two-component system cell cycle response regulator
MNQNVTGSSTPAPEEAPASTRLSVAVMQAENQRLRQQLEGMLHEARQNQDKMRRFDQIERKLIAAPSLAALIEILLSDYKDLFHLDVVTLALVDPQYEVAGILASASTSAAEGLHFFDSDQALQAVHGSTGRPLLAGPSPAHDFLFEGAPSARATVALLPLVHRGQLIGSLNLGSCDPQRFVPGSSTDFLARLAALVAVCLHNALATERLKLAGLTDGLTGVHNRRYFEARCLEEVLGAQRSGQPLVCLLLDVDHFKKVNDTLGHPAGDAVLRYVARLIKVQLRGSDVVARYGGEEFVVLLPATSLAFGLETAERIRQVIEAQSMPVGEHESVRVTVSIGVALLQGVSQAQTAPALMADLIARADQGMYQAKEGGRNRVVSIQAA